MNEYQQQEFSLATITCIECNVPWVNPSERWHAYLTDDDPPESLVYCHFCAEREFASPIVWRL